MMCSWLGKIQTVKELLVDNAEKARPSLEALAYAYIYLQVPSFSCSYISLDLAASSASSASS